MLLPPRHSRGALHDQHVFVPVGHGGEAFERVVVVGEHVDRHFGEEFEDVFAVELVGFEADHLVAGIDRQQVHANDSAGIRVQRQHFLGAGEQFRLVLAHPEQTQGGIAGPDGIARNGELLLCAEAQPLLLQHTRAVRGGHYSAVIQSSRIGMTMATKPSPPA